MWIAKMAAASEEATDSFSYSAKTASQNSDRGQPCQRAGEEESDTGGNNEGYSSGDS